MKNLRNDKKYLSSTEVNVKAFFINLTKEIKVSVGRFFSVFCLSILLFLLGSYMVIFEPEQNVMEILMRVCLTVSFGILLCTLGRILFEKYGERIASKRIFIEIGLVLISALAYPALLDFSTNRYVSAGYFGVMAALFCGVVYFACTDSISKTFSYIFKNTVFNYIVCGIITAGTMLSIGAFYSLVYEFENLQKAFIVDGMFIWIVLFLNLSLTAIPRKDAALKIPRLFKVIVINAALPVYLLLLAILCIYLGKILVTFSFPQGEINMYASFASLAFIFFIFAAEQYGEENRFAKIFVNYGGYVLIPIIAVQFVAVYIRLSNYGLTTARYVSLVLNIIALIFAAVSLVRGGRYIKHMLAVVALTALLLTLTPLNIFDVPIMDQTGRLTKVLVENGMIENGKVVAKEDLSEEDRMKITGAYDYIYYKQDDHNKLPGYLDNTEWYDLQQFFGKSETNEINIDRNPKSTNCIYMFDYSFIDVAGYSRIYNISSNGGDRNTFTFDKGDETVSFDLSAQAASLYAVNGSGSTYVWMEFDIGGDKLVFTRLNFNVDEDNNINVNNYAGYFLEK